MFPEEFSEAYSVLCESLYFGHGPRVDEEELASVHRGKRYRTSQGFADGRLFPTKQKADRLLAGAARKLQRWTWERARERRQGASPDRRSDLARAGEAGDRS